MPYGSHLSIWLQTAQSCRLPASTLPGFGCVSLCNRGVATDPHDQLPGQSGRLRSRVHCNWMVWPVLLVNLLFNMWVTVHLFSFAVLHKNPTKLEPLYVVTSLLVPAAIASVPLATQSYGLSQVDGCNMPVYSSNSTVKLDAAVIERFALWEGPAMSISLTASTAMFVMVIRFAHRVWWRTNNEPIADNDQYWKAIKQLIPLAFFPIFFFVFIIPYFMYDIYYSFFTPTPNRGLVTFENVSILLWSLSSGLTLNVHIFVSRMCVKKTRPSSKQNSSLYF